MPPKACPCACPVRRKPRRGGRRPRPQRVPQMLPPPGILQPQVSQVQVQPPMLQAPIKREVEKITKGTQYQEPAKTIEVQTEAPKRSEIGVGTEAPIQRVSNVAGKSRLFPKGISKAVGTETKTAEVGLQAGARAATREMGIQATPVPPAKPIHERIPISYSSRVGREFGRESRLSSIKEGGQPGRPTKAQVEARVMQKVEAEMKKESAPVSASPLPPPPPKPKQTDIRSFFGGK